MPVTGSQRRSRSPLKFGSRANIRRSSLIDLFGVFHEQDEKDPTKCQLIVEEFNNKHLENQQKAKPTAFNCNRFQDEVQQKSERIRVCTGSDETSFCKKRREMAPDEVRSRKPFSNMTRNYWPVLESLRPIKNGLMKNWSANV